MAKTKRKKSVPYEPELLKDLTDVEFASHFLTSCIDGTSDEDFDVFFDALMKVVKANGVVNVARFADISRDSLYKAFTEHKNPTLKSFRKILHALNFEIAIVPRKATG
jgi:probable addiction module antidote protein